MLTEEKIEAVKKQLRNGEPEGEIKNELRNQGYSKEEISTFFKPSQINLRSYLISGFILFAFGIYRITFYHNGRVFFILAIIAFIIYFKEKRQRTS